MASAVLVSRNESYWGERKVYMRKNSNSNAYLKANPSKPKRSPKKQIYDSSSQIHRRKTDGSPIIASVASNDSTSLNRKFANVDCSRESSFGGYVTFNVAAYSPTELKDLKKRLSSELEQVRTLSDQIELREYQSRSGYSASQFSGGCGGRDVTSSTRPLPSLLNFPDALGTERSKEKRLPKANQVHPLESKKISGKKRPLPFVSSKDQKRLASEPAAAKNNLSSAMKKCGHFLTKLMKHKHAWIFNVPVDVAGMGLHDYNKIINHPMDLGSVKSKLSKNLYASPLDFASDVRLTFENALAYNPKGHDVYVMAEQLLACFEEMFKPEYRKYKSEEGETQRSSRNNITTSECAKKADPTLASNLPQPTPRPSSALAPAVKLGKQPKPKAKDLHKRDMSLEEKEMLSRNLQNLPQEKMDQVVQIIRKRNANLAQHEDEIEIDIEVVDTETLWELDRFVGYYKKMVSKIKRQAVAVNRNSEAVEGNKAQFLEMPEAAVSSKKIMKGETSCVEEDVDIGEDMPAVDFPPVEIEKDAGYGSGSSSSSSDDSSSSDSDSGSSSGSDSDADDARSPGP